MELTRFGGHPDLGHLSRGRGPDGPSQQVQPGVPGAGRGARAVDRQGDRAGRPRLSINDTTLGNWVKADEAERGVPDGSGLLPLTAAERAELTKLRRENAKLKVEREILKKAAAFFAKESTR
jgi:transposase-like protein